MSVESARAFCVRMMSDEDFRMSLGAASNASEIDAALKKEAYDFKKNELMKVIGELIGKKLEESELEKLVCGFYEEQIKQGDANACTSVVQWIRSLQ